ncbi:MAG: hypothetical protein HUJ25_07610 [Crocinitomicaceae bacterium]|nr:hypothetical protein [Crocinitomicaceae bacterium]
MSYKYNNIKERFDLHVDGANKTVKGEFELDKNSHLLMGVAITSDQDQLVFYRGSQKIQLNDSELFPEGFESRLLMSSVSVPPNQRMVKIGLKETGNGRVEVWYTDKDHPNPNVKFRPYRVTFYFFSIPGDRC